MEKTIPVSNEEAAEFSLTAENERELADILSRYPNKQAACIPLLHLCQDQHGGVSPGVIAFVAACAKKEEDVYVDEPVTVEPTYTGKYK